MAVAQMRVPTIFTAVDKFSDVVSRMTSKTAHFSKSTVGAINRVDHKLNNMWGSMNNISQLAIGGGVGGLFYYAGKDVMDYETAIHSLGAVTGTVVGSMNKDIESLGKETGRSVIDIAKSFENIGSKMSEHLKNPEALREIAKQGILMANASGMSVDDATDNITSLLNQFKLSYKDANRVVNKLSVGEDVGASTISESVDMVRQFASSARMAGANLEETIALIQATTKTLGKQGVGRGFRNLMVDISTGKGMDKNKLKALKMVDADINKIINPATLFVDKLKEIKKLLSNPQAMGMFFKKTGFETGGTFLESFGLFEEYLGGIYERNTAAEKAAKNTATFSYAIDQLKNSFTNFVVTNNQANGVLGFTKDLIIWMTKNMGNLIRMATLVTLTFLGWKVIVGIVQLTAFATATYSRVLRFHALVTRFATMRNLTYAASLRAVALAKLASLGPIALVVGALGLLAYSMWDTEEASNNMANAQISNLGNINNAYINSTNVISEQLKKQQALLDNAVNKTKTPLSGNKFYDEASKLDPMSPNFDVQKFNELNAKGSQLSKENFITNILPRFTKKEPDYLKKEGFSNPENLAGKRDLEIERMYRFAAKERDLNIKISTEDGLKAETEGNIPSGVEVKTTPNQGSRGK